MSDSSLDSFEPLEIHRSVKAASTLYNGRSLVYVVFNEAYQTSLPLYDI